MTRALCALLVVAGLAPAAPEKPGEQFLTITYDLAPLLRNPSAWRRLPDVKDLPTDPHEALAHILFTDQPARWLKGGTRLQFQGGNKLEVHATAAHHIEIKAMLGTLERLTDCAVIVTSFFLDVERDHFDKKLAPKPAGSRPRELDEETLKALVAKSKVAPEKSVTLVDGAGGALCSRRRAIPLSSRPVGGGEPAIHGVAWDGVAFRGTVQVSNDRRSIRLRLEQAVSELRGFNETTVWSANGRRLVQTGDVVETTTAVSADVWDGGSLLVPIQHRPHGVKQTDRVPMLLLQFRIRIEAEERALREQQQQKEP